MARNSGNSPLTEHTLVPCFVCEKSLERVNGEEMQPYGGVICRSSGNYGSRALDGYEPSVCFLICDECLTERVDRVRRVKTKQISPEVTYESWEYGRERVIPDD